MDGATAEWRFHMKNTYLSKPCIKTPTFYAIKTGLLWQSERSASFTTLQQESLHSSHTQCYVQCLHVSALK